VRETKPATFGARVKFVVIRRSANPCCAVRDFSFAGLTKINDRGVTNDLNVTKTPCLNQNQEYHLPPMYLAASVPDPAAILTVLDIPSFSKRITDYSPIARVLNGFI